jgi:hypothetical protein
VWVAGTPISLTAPCVWALSSDTTQSFRPPVSEAWPTPTMLCTETQQGGRSDSIAFSGRELGSSMSIVVGTRRSNSGRNPPGFIRIT